MVQTRTRQADKLPITQMLRVIRSSKTHKHFITIIYNFFRRKTRHGDCNRGTAGFAYVGGACVVNKRLEKV